MLQQDLVEIILQAMSREFYQRKRPEEFFEWPGIFLDGVHSKSHRIHV